jgi:pyridoxal phosphate enzyme (YggS family)
MLTGPQFLPARLEKLQASIASAALSAGRLASDITLIAVSKGQSAEQVALAHRCGLTDFGENYLQEALAKMDALPPVGLTWHFIGRLQTNKTRAVAERFDWVHTVDRLKVAERLAQQRPASAAPLNVCLQVRLAEEDTKGGVLPADLPTLAHAVKDLPQLRLRGLMCLPPAEPDPTIQRGYFAELRRLHEGLIHSGIPLDALSMGMSHDFESAILEGATHIRVGTALFGSRGP